MWEIVFKRDENISSISLKYLSFFLVLPNIHEIIVVYKFTFTYFYFQFPRKIFNS